MSEEPWEEFTGEYPALPPMSVGDRRSGFVSGNYVDEPGAYACVACAGPGVVLRPGQRIPACLRCGHGAIWEKR